MKNNNNGRFDVRKGMKLVGSSEYSSIEQNRKGGDLFRVVGMRKSEINWEVYN